jgi:hypothetical protein
MNKLRLADSSKLLKGKTIERCNWHNEPEEDYCCRSIFFTDETMVSLRFHRLENPSHCSGCLKIQCFDAVTEGPELAAHPGGALSLRGFRNRWAPFLITYFPV